MKTNKSFAYIIIVVGIAICACRQPRQAVLPEWLAGTWETGDTLGLVTESWEKVNDNFMSGEGSFVSKSGKTIIEMLSIFIQNGMLVYTAMLPNQNNGEEIIFVDSGYRADSLVLENPAHDYPKKIIYYRRHADTLDVAIYGGNADNINTITLTRTAE